MATFRGVAGFLLRKVGENSFVRWNSGLFRWRNRPINGQVTALQGHFRTNSSKEGKVRKDEPISYSKSPAHGHRVNDTLQYNSSQLNSYRSLIICFGVFSFIVYYGFIREESDTEKKIFELDEMQDSPILQSGQDNATNNETREK